ncbi:MAG: dTMP kinase [Pseudomonadota bacterium]
MAGEKKGWFIVFEGIDGSGKSTQIQNTAQWLSTFGRKVYSTFEPTNGPVGTLIRQMLEGKVATDQRTIASLFAADRTDHLLNAVNGIKKMVDDGCVVLCDRYYFSSYAYHAQHIDMEWVIHSNSLNAQILRPDVTVFIDVDPKICFERIQKNRGSFDMYEKMDIMEKVRINYFKAFERLKKQETVAIVDGNASIDQVGQSIKDKILKHVDLLAG